MFWPILVAVYPALFLFTGCHGWRYQPNLERCQLHPGGWQHGAGTNPKPWQGRGTWNGIRGMFLWYSNMRRYVYRMRTGSILKVWFCGMGRVPYQKWNGIRSEFMVWAVSPIRKWNGIRYSLWYVHRKWNCIIIDQGWWYGVCTASGVEP